MKISVPIFSDIYSFLRTLEAENRPLERAVCKPVKSLVAIRQAIASSTAVTANARTYATIPLAVSLWDKKLNVNSAREYCDGAGMRDGPSFKRTIGFLSQAPS